MTVQLRALFSLYLKCSPPPRDPATFPVNRQLLSTPSWLPPPMPVTWFALKTQRSSVPRNDPPPE